MAKTVPSKVMWVSRATVFLVGLTVILALLIAVGQRSAHAEVTGVEGSVYGYHLNVTVFGSPQPPWDRLPR